MDRKITTIDLTPTWGEIGNVYTRLAASNEQKALEGMKSEVARAFAAAEALQQIQQHLPDDLREIACKVMAAELAKQGVAPKQATQQDQE